MLKKIWFQTHWLLGITAGVVLAVVGLTGATLSFEHDILRLLNPAVMSVEPSASQPLSVTELIRRAQSAMPDKTVIGVTLDSDPSAAGQIGFAGGRRGDWHYQNPYTGKVLGKPTRGEDTLHLMEDIHRRLAGGDVGKQIVGACTIALLVLALSGLYLRWPRQMSSWRIWLTFSWARKGRSFLWDLHSIIGTWVLPLYLLAALTGLYWSYDWYRDGLFELTGAPRPNPSGQMAPGQVAQAGAAQPGQGQGGASKANPAPAANESAKPGGEGQVRKQASGERGEEKAPAPAMLSDVALTQLWQQFAREIPAGYRSATLRLPERAGAPVEIRYLDAEPAHGRANNTISFDAESFAVVKHERYADLKPGTKLMRSMFALHSGEFFGVIGLVLMMIASLLMPLFAITGWMLYLDRRGKKRAARRAAKALNGAGLSAGEPLLIGYASQTGYAEQLAWQTAGALQAAGLPVQVTPLAAISGDMLEKFRHALFVVSTFGDGEAPDAARPFAKRIGKNERRLQQLRYAVLALGDRQYQAFCGFGRAVEQWLHQQGASALFERIDVDKGDPTAIAAWQQQLQQLTGAEQPSVWQTATTEVWNLRKRQQLNIGSLGAPMFHLELVPAPHATNTNWQAGDLVEVWPRHSTDGVNKLATALDLPITEPTSETYQTLARSEWPTDTQLAQWRLLPAVQRLQQLQALQSRSYSIASIPADGSLHLLVRQERHADGSLGLGSGWLTAYAGEHCEVELQIKRNSSFHNSDLQRPMILIGNGSGLSSLRAHLRAAAMQQCKGHWLIFGERSRQFDFYYQQEIEQWQTDGTLARVDLAFSRDQSERIYVQDRLRAAGPTLQDWLQRGAVIFVCGSAVGMAPAVEQVLVELLGVEGVGRLLDDGRYRRDVY